MARLPVPVPGPAVESRLSRLSESLATAATAIDAMPEYAECQALAAQLYNLRRSEFEHMLTTFPLIEETLKRRCMDAFLALA
jgi:hypothetical protein